MNAHETLASLNAKKADLAATLAMAKEREEATLHAFLRGKGTEARHESWSRKRQELGIMYYETCDLIIELEEQLGI
jgi:hypothetical protein